MLSAVSLELTSLINSDLTWKKIAKGKRSTSRRARKLVARSSRASAELINRKSKRVDMPVSESEKLGVTVLGCHFSGKAEHVPIKKRRFLFRSPSPPPRSTSPRPQEIDRLAKSELELGQGSHPDSLTRCQVGIVDVASANDLGQIVKMNVDDDVKKLEKINGQADANEAFSGISILAAAAAATATCDNSLGQHDGFSEMYSGAEDSTIQDSPPKVLSNNESCYFLNGLSKEDVSSAKVLSEGIGSSIASLTEDNSSPHGNIMEGKSLQDYSGAVAQDLLSKDDRTCRTRNLSSRDDRLHWDLNTAMDVWECQFDYQVVDPKSNVANANLKKSGDSKLTDNKESTEEVFLQREPGVLKADTEKTLSSMSGEITQETKESNVPECKLDATNNIQGTICLPEKPLSCEIDSASNNDLAKEIQSLDHQGIINHNNGPVFSISVEESGRSTSTNENPSHLPQVAGLDSCSDHSLSSERLLTRTCKCEDNCNATCCGLNTSNMNECTTDRERGELMSSKSEFKNQKATLPLVALPGKSTDENGDDLIENVGDPGQISYLPNEQNIPKDLVCMESSQPLGTGCLDYVGENAVYKSDEMGSTHFADACDAIQIAVAGDKNVHHNEVSAHDNADTDAQMRIDAGETTSKCFGESTTLSGRPSALGSHDDAQRICTDISDNCDKLALKESLGHNYDSDIPQDDSGSAGGLQQTCELQVDYDSQYEDGELRESIEHTWEEYDVEDGEAEHIDYGSDDRDVNSFDAADHHISMSEGTGRKNHRFADTNSSCSEADLSLKNEQESRSRSCRKAFTMSKAIPSRSNKERAVKICQPCGRPQASAQDSIDECDISGQVDKELGTGPEKLISDNEILAGKDVGSDSKQSLDLNILQIGQDRLSEGCKSSLDIATGVCSDRKKRIGDGTDAKDADAKVFGSRASKRESQSRVNGLANHGMFPRKDRPQGSRVNDVDDLESRSVRDWNTVKSFRTGRDSQQIHYRSWRGDHRVDYPEGHKGFKRRFSPSFPAPTNFPRQVSENVGSMVSGKVEKDNFVALNGTSGNPVGDGPSDHTWRQTTDPSSHGADGPMKRSGSPVDRYRDLGTRPAGSFSRGSATVDRGRFIRRYGPRFEDRGPRGRYHGPVADDCIESSSNYSHHLARRERSFSPIERRRDFHLNRPCTKSPSRSRTRSPNGWQSPKGRNRTGPAGRFQHRSRSPDFRYQGRMQRMRSPHQRAGFSTDQMIGFMSMPRRRGSPQRNTRWIDDREEGVVHFREQGYKQRSSVLDRRSPARIFSRDDSFGFADSQEMLKENDYSRSMHPGRFSRMNGVGRGGPRYEGSDEDRRHGYRYGLVHPLGRRDTDGALKRFRYDNEDGFVAEHKSRNKGAAEFIGRQSPKDCSEGMDSQINDVARTSRGGRGSFSHRRDGKFSANSKSFEVQDIDEDVSPKRRIAS